MWISDMEVPMGFSILMVVMTIQQKYWVVVAICAPCYHRKVFQEGTGAVVENIGVLIRDKSTYSKM